MRNRVTRFLRHLQSRSRIDEEALAFGLAELETFEFHRPGAGIESRVLQGRAGALPWSTGFEWGPDEDPFGDDGYEEATPSEIGAGDG